METKSKTNGQAIKMEPVGQMKDTAKGAEIGKEVMKLPVSLADPIAGRLAKIHEVHTLSEKRKKLIETQDDLRLFESGYGESDRITLKNHGGSTVEVKRPEALKKVLNLLKDEVDNALAENNREIMAASL